MRISDLSSDVCSTDLNGGVEGFELPLGHTIGDFNEQPDGTCSGAEEDDEGQLAQAEAGKGGERQLRLAHLLGQPAKRPRQALHPLPLVLCCLGFACNRATLLPPGADYSSFSIALCDAQAGGSAMFSATESTPPPS